MPCEWFVKLSIFTIRPYGWVKCFLGICMKKSDSNLVWIDLEMTGLDVQNDVILEIATIITDKDLHIIAEGPELVIHHEDEILARMDGWVQDTHTKSGLVEKVRLSDITCTHAQEETLAFIQMYCEPKTALLAGNSVWQDRNFLAQYMPHIIDYLFYRLIDVSTVKELVHRWYPQDPQIQFVDTFIKKETHRALQDIRESIAELQHYRRYFFTSS